MRRQIVERVSTAKRRIPHFSYIEEVDVTELERLRQQLNALHEVVMVLRGTLTEFLIRTILPADVRRIKEVGEAIQINGGRRFLATFRPPGLALDVLLQMN